MYICPSPKPTINDINVCPHTYCTLMLYYKGPICLAIFLRDLWHLTQSYLKLDSLEYAWFCGQDGQAYGAFIIVAPYWNGKTVYQDSMFLQFITCTTFHSIACYTCTTFLSCLNIPYCLMLSDRTGRRKIGVQMYCVTLLAWTFWLR